MVKRKVKILIISEPGSGGVKRHVIDLLTNLDESIFEIVFAYSTKRAEKEYLEEISGLSSKISVKAIKHLQQPISLKNDSLAFIEICKLISYLNPDIVHCHSSKAGVLGRIAAKLFKVPKIIYTPHAYAFQNNKLSNSKRRFYLLIEKFLTRYFTTKTINVSYGEMKIALDNRIDEKEQFIVIHNGVERQTYELNKKAILKNLKIAEGDIIIGNIARLEEQKNPLEFFEIARCIKENSKNFKFLWIGNGSLLQKCQDFIEKNKLENICFILPFDKKTEKLIKTFNIFLSTSLYEGYPYVLLDANANKIPIVASNVTGNNEIVKNNVNGFLYKSGDTVEAKKIITQYSIWYKNLNFYKLDTLKQMVENIQKLYLME